MAQRRIFELIDDLDGTTAHETVVFGLDSRDYEIDLSTENAEKLRGMLAAYESAGRRLTRRSPVARTTSRRVSTPASRGGDDSSVIREWAAQNGHAVNSRGRIPASVRAAYESR